MSGMPEVRRSRHRRHGPHRVRQAQGRARRLASDRPARLRAAHLLERNGVDPAIIDDVVGGCVTQSGEQGCNVTRNAWVAAGLPWQVPATSVDRQCGSSQQAVHFVAQGVIAGAYDIAIACGVESMTRAPMSSNATRRHRPVQRATSSQTRTTRSGSSSGSRRCSPTSGASHARRWTRSRCSRHRRAAANTDNGFFAGEIVPVPIKDETASSPARCSTPTRASAATATIETLAGAAARVGV